MDEEMKKRELYRPAFQAIKNIIIAQNKVFIKDIAKKFKKDPEELIKKYITPDNYLPIIEWHLIKKPEEEKESI